ncbi:ROK family protein [Planotetraspora mira]|uniref:Glucokinase n=1 Tax=Planotetraspora mira TaxID=58121 RepID=A0A8J3TSU2_9ACTN|nr:ROK family protein [Planotetraspora mira]GII31706.1 glucokinase [Planotetraspora mira]
MSETTQPLPYVLGIDFGGTKVALTVAPLSAAGVPPGAASGVSGAAPGAALEAALGTAPPVTRLETRGFEGAAEVVRRTVLACRALVASQAGDLVAVGVSTFGIVRDGVVRLAPNVPGWEGLPLPGLLRQEFGGTPVFVANDVKAATAAELRWGNLAGVRDGIYLNLGTGLAAGLVVDGRVIRGAHGAAGEIAYLARHADDLRVPRPADGSGGVTTRQQEVSEPAAARAHLEEYVSGVALAGRGTELLGSPVTAAQLFERGDEPRVRTLLDDAFDALGLALANLCVTLDPSRVVVGGGMMGAASLIMPHLREAVRQAVPYPPEIVAARFVDDAPLYGALALALDGDTPAG